MYAEYRCFAYLCIVCTTHEWTLNYAASCFTMLCTAIHVTDLNSVIWCSRFGFVKFRVAIVKIRLVYTLEQA